MKQRKDQVNFLRIKIPFYTFDKLDMGGLAKTRTSCCGSEADPTLGISVIRSDQSLAWNHLESCLVALLKYIALAMNSVT